LTTRTSSDVSSPVCSQRGRRCQSFAPHRFGHDLAVSRCLWRITRWRPSSVSVGIAAAQGRDFDSQRGSRTIVGNSGWIGKSGIVTSANDRRDKPCNQSRSRRSSDLGAPLHAGGSECPVYRWRCERTEIAGLTRHSRTLASCMIAVQKEAKGRQGAELTLN
jgi:hypothetical protein